MGTGAVALASRGGTWLGTGGSSAHVAPNPGDPTGIVAGTNWRGWGGTGSSPPTFLHQPPVGRRAADKQEDAEEEQGQADARHRARCYAGRTRLRVLACERTDVTARGQHLLGLGEPGGELLATYTRLGCGSRSAASGGCPGRGAGGGRRS